ncbi:MAG TPA: hypothetical protein VF147_14495 [Vicinamibacterales bacterium]
MTPLPLRLTAPGRAWLRGAIALLFLLSPQLARAQASLAAEDIIDEVPVKIGNVVEKFTVLRDAIQVNQWYYVPDQPRIVERLMSNGQREPEFALVRFQFKDPANPEQLAEGGFLQFAMSLGLPPEAIPQLKSAIATRTGGDASTIRLAALPFKSAVANLYIPKSGLLVASEPVGPGIAPTFATQKMTYAIPLSKIGSDVYDTLVNGTTGLAAGIEFTYTGLTPPVGFTVTVDWDQAYSFYSKDEKIRAELSLGGWFGGKANIDRNKMVETLKQNKVFTIEEIDNPENGAKYLEMLLERINKELLQNAIPPQNISEASAADPTVSKNILDKLKNKYFGSLGYSVAIKQRSQVRSGKERISFKSRKLQERKTLASGFVGIGSYPEDVRKRLVTVVPPGPWKSAYFLLPNVGDAQEIGISQVDLEIRLKKADQTHSTQVAVWKPATGWAGVGSKDPRTLLAFGLMDLYTQDPTLKDVRFDTATQITLKNEVLRVNDSLPVDDQRAIVTPLSATKVIRLDTTSLSWAGLAPDSKLVSANVSLRAGDRSFNTLVKPRLADSKLVPPAPVNWIVPRDVSSIVATITFRLSDGSTVTWSDNGKNLASGQENAGDLYIELVDTDWRKGS